MTKRKVLILLSALSMTCAFADRISVEQARENSAAFLTAGSTSQQRIAGKLSGFQFVKASKGYYIFTGRADNGYVIAATDDQMAAPVLGYADAGVFDETTMPDNMRWWLSEYDREAEWLETHRGNSIRKSPSEREEILPLLTTLWNQDAPYNNDCPVESGYRCPTGCVATAVAQIMNYHQWPVQGRDSHAYKWNGKTLSADFSQSTYDWAAMADTYDDYSSAASQAAVVLLMSDVGIALEMGYSAAASGAYSNVIPEAMAAYFRYSREACYYERTHYRSEEWESMVYESLARCEPVYYSGCGSAGHAFVCDGYSEGYYHFNWGWGGTSNGYFLLTALNPSSQGWGGSSNGYSAGQGIVTGLRPDCDDSTTPIAYMTSSNEFSMTRYQGQWYSISYGFFNATNHTINTTVGIEVVDEAGNSTFGFLYDPEELDASTGWGTTYTSSDFFPKADGTYKVYPAYYDANHDTSHRLHTTLNYNGFCYLTVNGGQYEVTQPESLENDFQIELLNAPSFYAGKYATVNLRVTNLSDHRSTGDMIAGVLNGDYSAWASNTWFFIDLEPGASGDYMLKVQIPNDTKSTYHLAVVDGKYQAFYLNPITISAVPAGAFSGMLLSAPVLEVKGSNHVKIDTEVSCLGGYEDEFIVWFYNGNTGSWIGDYLMNGDAMGAGDTAALRFEGTVNGLEPSTEYFYTVCAYQDGGNYTLSYDSTKYFFFRTPDQSSTAISDVLDIEAQPAPLYNLQGQRITSPVKGQLYICKGKKLMER